MAEHQKDSWAATPPPTVPPALPCRGGQGQEADLEREQTSGEPQGREAGLTCCTSTFQSSNSHSYRAGRKQSCSYSWKEENHPGPSGSTDSTSPSSFEIRKPLESTATQGTGAPGTGMITVMPGSLDPKAPAPSTDIGRPRDLYSKQGPAIKIPTFLFLIVFPHKQAKPSFPEMWDTLSNSAT